MVGLVAMTRSQRYPESTLGGSYFISLCDVDEAYERYLDPIDLFILALILVQQRIYVKRKRKLQVSTSK